MLRTPELLQFAQRVSSDYHLKPLVASEVVEYITFRLRAVGSKTALFSAEACQLIAHASGGIPRTINILCDTALVYGYGNQASQITSRLVAMVIQDKQLYGVLPPASLADLK
jgi:type II secretory pathway predicted ATPase ExeA